MKVELDELISSFIHGDVSAGEVDDDDSEAGFWRCLGDEGSVRAELSQGLVAAKPSFGWNLAAAPSRMDRLRLYSG